MNVLAWEEQQQISKEY